MLPLLLLLILTGPPQEKKKEPAAEFPQRETITGNWDGLRTTLEQKGLKFTATWIGELWGIPSGGLRRGAVYLDNVDLTLRLDLERLAKWHGVSAFVYGLGIDGTTPNRYVGSVQGVSNIEAPSLWELYEAWIQKTFSKVSLSLLAGLYDLNSEFDVLETALLFLNPSHGIDPTFAYSGTAGPSVFPTTTVGVRARWIPWRHFYLQSVLLNGTAGHPGSPGGLHYPEPSSRGVLSTTEGGYVFRFPRAEAAGRDPQRRRERIRHPEYRGKIALGAWFYTSKFRPIGPPEPISGASLIGGDRGIYILAERALTTKFSAFTRLAMAGGRINRLKYYTGAGVVYSEPLGRVCDEAGIGLATAYNGSEYLRSRLDQEGPVSNAEWNIEATYRFRAYPWLYLQPDAQYFIHPDTNPENKNAWALALRVEVKF